MTKVPAQMFSGSEIQAHRGKLPTIAATAAKYLDDVYADHLAFYNRWGYQNITEIAGKITKRALDA
jgi:hypothetical protein